MSTGSRFGPMRVPKRPCVLLFISWPPSQKLFRRRATWRPAIANWECSHSPFACKTFLVKATILGQHKKAAVLEHLKRSACSGVLDVQSFTRLAHAEAYPTVVEAIPALRDLDKERPWYGSNTFPSFGLQQVVRKREKAIDANASAGLIDATAQPSSTRHCRSPKGIDRVRPLIAKSTERDGRERHLRGVHGVSRYRPRVCGASRCKPTTAAQTGLLAHIRGRRPQ